MSDTATAPASEAKPEKKKNPRHNEDMRVAKIMAKAQRAHDWRVQVWAQSEQRIQAMNAELQAMGREPFQPYEPDFTDKDRVAHYAEMSLPK